MKIISSIVFAFLIPLAFSCGLFKKVYLRDTVELKTGTTQITLYNDSTFVEKRDSNKEVKRYYGHWRYIDLKDSILETTIEGSGMDIYTLTSKNVYQKIDGRLRIKE